MTCFMSLQQYTRSVNHVVVKNSELVKDYSKMKSPRLDLLVEFDDQTTVDLEMQLRQAKDNLPIRFSYYLARLHGLQELEGKYYGELKETEQLRWQSWM